MAETTVPAAITPKKSQGDADKLWRHVKAGTLDHYLAKHVPLTYGVATEALTALSDIVPAKVDQKDHQRLKQLAAPLVPGTGPRTAPKIGDTQHYKVLRSAYDRLIVQIPLAMYGFEHPGAEVEVEFAKSGPIIRVGDVAQAMKAIANVEAPAEPIATAPMARPLSVAQKIDSYVVLFKAQGVDDVTAYARAAAAMAFEAEKAKAPPEAPAEAPINKRGRRASNRKSP